MRISRPALEQVREYAAARGCTELDLGGRRFIAPDRSRAIRISEIQSDTIYVWDTAAGIISMPRERRSTRIHDKPEAQVDKAVPGKGDGEIEKDALAGQFPLLNIGRES